MVARRLLAWTALALSLAPSAAAPPARVPPRAAVADFIVTGPGEPRYWLGYVYSEVLARRLMRCSGMLVVEPLESREAQAGIGPQDLTSLGTACLELARTLQVPWVVSGQIEDKGATLVITPLVASAAAGKSWSPASAEVPIEKLYEPQVTILLERFLRDMGVRGLPRGEWQTLVDYDPGLPLDVAELVGEGWRAYAPDAPEQAMELWKQALLRDPGCILAAEAIARASYRYRRVLLQRSLEFYERLVNEEPNNAHGHYHLGQVLLDVDDMTSAASHFIAALDLRPSFLEARLGLGLAYLGLSFNDRAETQFALVLEQEPNHYKALQNLAVASFRRGRLAEAVKVWEDILTKYPGDPVAQRNLNAYRHQVRPIGDSPPPEPGPNPAP